MDHTHIVPATELERYASRRDSQAVIPELVYLLVKQSISQVSVCRIPYGDAVNQRGWDGLVQSEEAFLEFVPSGISYWEIGTGADPQAKATTEFKKRTKKLSDKEKSQSTFVFVTPRAAGADGWNEPKQTAWLKRRKDKGWGRIRIIDGVKLADWLREFPAIGRWLAKRIGLTSSLAGLETPAEHWEDLLSLGDSSDPPMPARIFTAGRENACSALQALFEGKSQRLIVFAESESDVADFVAAYLALLDDDVGRLFSNRCLFISDSDAWHSVVMTRKAHVLVADPKLGLDSDQSKLQSVATSKGHAVVIPICGAWSGGNPDITKLRSPSKSKLETVFSDAGYSTVRARELADIGADRLSALKRHLLGLGSLPPYATWRNARLLAQAGLAGKWDASSKADQDALELLLGKDYGEWIETIRPEVLRADTPLLQRNEKWRILSRGEAWGALGARVTDDDLDRLKDAALVVLGENDPKFTLPKEEHYTAGIHGKVLQHSSTLREGIAETLALLGSRESELPHCSQGKANSTVVLTVRELLNEADWVRWASLDGLLPLIAEAAPDEFLDAVELALSKLDESPFHQVFAQEGSSGIGGWNYISGLLWALEGLAWHPDYLTRVVLILGDLASIDPGGNWSNRPANSMSDILLPWHLQTCASMDRRKSAVQALLKEQPDVGWELLLALLPNNRSFTSGSHRPVWRNFIGDDWTGTVTHAEYWEQISVYAELALGLATSSVGKLCELIKVLPDLPEEAQHTLLSHLGSAAVTDRPESDRMAIWDTLNDLARKHRKFSDAKWAMPSDAVADIEAAASLLAPTAPLIKYQYLFSGRDFDLYDEEGDYEQQRRDLALRREAAAKEIVANSEFKDLLNFANNVSVPFQFGFSLGAIGAEELEAKFLPGLLSLDEDVIASLVVGFVAGRHSKLDWKWVDNLLDRGWSKLEKARFLVLLPYQTETWTRVEKHLDDSDHLYWENVTVNPYWPDSDQSVAIKKLVDYGRLGAAIQSLGRLTRREELFDSSLAMRAMLLLIQAEEIDEQFDSRSAVQVIKRLQASDTSDKDSLFRIEWALLPILNQFSEGSPKTIENRLATSPELYCEVIGLVYRSKTVEAENEEPTEQQRDLARKGYQLLSEWSQPPGLSADGSFDPEFFKDWLAKTKEISAETGHKEVALNQFGHVLTKVPPDKEGLWIDEAVADALNKKDAQPMRAGFTNQVFNDRGVHGFSAGREESELARLNREKADALDSKGFSRFATAMRELAEGYERDAEREASRDPFED